MGLTVAERRGSLKSHCFIALGEEILLQPTGHT
jgi:hypothetical protein